jgi:hypothetical protein
MCIQNTKMLCDSRCISLLHSFRAACLPAHPKFCLGLDGFFVSVQALFRKSYLIGSPEVLPQARCQADTVRTNVTCGVYDVRHLVVLSGLVSHMPSLSRRVRVTIVAV